MTNSEKLSAISWAAHERGLTYGEYMGRTTAQELEAVYKEYAARLQAKREIEREREARQAELDAAAERRAERLERMFEFGHEPIDPKKKKKRRSR